MANEQSGVKFFIILSILLGAAVGPCMSDDDDDSSPIIDVIQSFMKESSKGQAGGIGVLGPMLQGFLQSGGGKNLGDLLAGAGGRKSSTMNLLAGLGSILQARKEGQNDGGGFDPAVIGTVLDLFSSMSQSDDQGAKKPKRETGNEIDWGSMLSLVGNAMSSGDEKSNDNSNNGFETIMSFLPVIMSSISGRHHPHSSGNVKHHDHAPFLPPILENIHEYWDHFTTSQFGRTLWENSGLSALAAMFHDENGNFQAQKLFESLENNAFRRRWIKSIASFTAEWANHVADAETQKRYLETIEVVTNGFLQTQGYPQKTLLNLKKPAESLSALINEVFKRQLHLDVNSVEYIKPAVNYFQHVFGASKKAGFLSDLTADTVESKLRQTLETQLIDPVLRANRAYRFATKHKQCGKYVLCVIESNSMDHDGIKPAVVKAANLATAWFLSTPLKTPFFELAGSTGADDCDMYNNNCSEFLDVDTKATTEYFHNEL